MFSKDILNIALEHDTRENLRIWMNLRPLTADKSGHFTLDDLANFYNFNDKSNAKKIKIAKSKQFKKSIFFEHLKDDLFKIVSENKILLKYNGTTTTTKFEIPLECLKSKRLFLDFCIGVIKINSGFSNETASKILKVTPRRIQQGTSRNDQTGTFIKEQQKVLEFFKDRSEALIMIDKLFNIGIKGIKPVKIGKDWIISLNATNRYFFTGVIRHNGRTRKGKRVKREEKTESYFKPVFKGKGSKSLKEKYEQRFNGKVLMYNDSVYNLDMFVQDHAEVCN